MKFEQSTKNKFADVADDFPKCTIFSPKEVDERNFKKSRLKSYDEKCFFFNDGSLDEKWIENMWYTFRGKNVEIQNFGEFLYSHIPFHEYFSQSAAFSQMMSRPDNDSKRRQVIDYLTALVMRTLNTDLRKKISEVSGMREKIESYVKAEIEKDAYFLREHEKWASQYADSLEKKGLVPELKRFKEMCEKNEKSLKEIQDIITKRGWWLVSR